MAGLWLKNPPACGRIPLIYGLPDIQFRSMRMASPKCFFRMFTESGPLIALAVAGVLLVGIVGPASAQFFNFGAPPQRPQPQQRGGGGWFGGDLFTPFQQQPHQQAPRQRVIREDFSRAPPPDKRDTTPE